MNERIKELEKLSVYYNEEEETWEFNREKFAELIVQECVNALQNNRLWNRDISRALTEHFGVE